jgi:hypothetical protein
MLRFVGPLCINCELFDSNLSTTQRASLLHLSRICVAFGGLIVKNIDVNVDNNSPLLKMELFARGKLDSFVRVLTVCVDDHAVASLVRQMDTDAAITVCDIVVVVVVLLF